MDEYRRSLIAVVTGASSGLGRALSQCLTAKGVHVVGVSRNESLLAETARGCSPGSFTAVSADVSRTDEMSDVGSYIENNVGPVSILINNAAICLHQDFLNSTSEDIIQHIHVNNCGPIIAAKVFIPGMLQRRRGRIINVGSFAGDGPAAGKLGYSVSKAGFRSFSHALAVELEKHLPAITVTEWIPGILATQIGRPQGLSPSEAAQWGAKLAMDFRPEFHGMTFVENMEMQDVAPLRRRLVDKFLRRPRRMPHILCPDADHAEPRLREPTQRYVSPAV